MKKVIIKTASAVLVGSLFLGVSSGHAKEGGDQYANGAENWFAGAAPRPGNYFINYLGNYSGKLKDGNGNNAIVADKTPTVDAVFNALRFLKVTEQTLWGGNWGWHVIVPVVNQKIDFIPQGGKAGKTGLGDITINPFILSWHRPEWHTVVGLDIHLPSGAYDKNDLRKSIGVNYTSIEPVFAVSYLGSNGWEVSGKFMYNIKTKNNATDYQSGDEFHMDYLVGKHIGNWGVGVSGYYLKQVNDDKQNGATVAAAPGVWSEGRRGQVFSIGPSVKYKTQGGTVFIGQWQHETKVENRFGGEKVLLKLIMPL